MSNSKNPVKQINPTYLKDFKCIGGSCEDSCCIGWDVDIDRITFRQYFRTKDSSMRSMFQSYIYKNEYCYSTEVDYGKVRMEASKRCPFLDENCYCKIFSNMGEEYLSNVCSSFPRVTNAIDDYYETSLYLSCPEAARLVLLNPEGICFEKNNQPLTKHVLGSIVDTRLAEYSDSPVKFFHLIRKKCISIIQNRNYPLTKRLKALGNFLEILDEKSDFDLASMYKYLNNFDTDNFSDLPEASSSLPLLVSLFQEWTNKLNTFSSIENAQFINYTKLVREAFTLDSGEDIKVKSALYEDSLQRYFEPFLEEYEYIFENDLVNIMFKNVFPFSMTHRMFDGYLMLIIHFLWVRFYMVAFFSASKEASASDAVKLIQVLAKTLDHHNTYMDDLFYELKDCEYDNMEFIKVLI